MYVSWRCGEGDDVFAKERIVVPAFTVNDVIDQAAEKRDVAAGAHRSINIAERRRAGEGRIGVDDRRAFLLRLRIYSNA